MTFTRKLSAIALGLFTALAVSSIANAQCDPLPGTRIGDANADGAHDVLDVVALVNIAFRGAAPTRFLGAADLNGDGVSSDVLDVVNIVNIAFRGAAANFPFRVFSLTGRSGLGTYTLIADDSIQYRFFGVYSVGEDRLDLGLTFTDRTDTLRIQAGTDVQGDSSTASPSVMTVRRTGYIHAVGTETDPVVFTSMLPVGSRERSDWGGITVNGWAPNNNAPTFIVDAEGDGGIGGGNLPNDNSGCLKYLRVEFAGREFTTDNELNGITLTSVGDGTTLEYVQINQNADDGLEWFGGRVNVRYGVMSGCDDDGYDTDIGAQWKGQFLVVISDPTKVTSANHQGLEWDGHPTTFTNTPVMKPTVWNMSLIGHGADSDPSTHSGLHLRRGANCDINNTVWTKYRRGLDVDNDPPAATLIASGDISVKNSIWYDIATFGADGDSATLETWAYTNGALANQVFSNPTPATPMSEIFVEVNYGDVGFPDFRPISGGNPINLDTQVGGTPPNDGWFDPTATFIGAFPANGTLWYTGWTDFSQN